LGVGLAIAAPLALTGCNAYPSYGPVGGHHTGPGDLQALLGHDDTGIIVGGLVGLLILWTIIRYRRRSETCPAVPRERPVEILYTVIPVIIVGILFAFTVLTENNVDAIQPVNATLTSSGQPVST